MCGNVSSHETGIEGSRTLDLLDGPGDFGSRGGASKDKRGSKSLLLNAFSAALKRRQSNEMSSSIGGSSPRRSLVSSSPEDLEDRRSDELNRRNHRAKVRSSDEKLNNNSTDYSNNPDTEEDDVVRKTHIIAQRLNRASVDLTGSTPKRRLNSVSWVTPEAEIASSTPTLNFRSPTSNAGPTTSPPTHLSLSPQTSPTSSSTFEGGREGNSRTPSFGDVSPGRARELSLSTIDEEATGSQWRMGGGPTSDRRGPVAMRSKQAVPPPSSSSRGGGGDGGLPLQDAKRSRRLTLPSLITVTQPVITVSSPDASPINGIGLHVSHIISSIDLSTN